LGEPISIYIFFLRRYNVFTADYILLEKGEYNMKKKLLWGLGVLAALLILATVVGPHLILAAVR